MLLVENQYDEFKLRDFLNQKGYKFVKRLGSDDVFFREEFSRKFSVRFNFILYQFQEWLEKKKLFF
jgi:hypothetical protein